MRSHEGSIKPSIKPSVTNIPFSLHIPSTSEVASPLISYTRDISFELIPRYFAFVILP